MWPHHRHPGKELHFGLRSIASHAAERSTTRYSGCRQSCITWEISSPQNVAPSSSASSLQNRQQTKPNSAPIAQLLLQHCVQKAKYWRFPNKKGLKRGFFVELGLNSLPWITRYSIDMQQKPLTRVPTSNMSSDVLIFVVLVTSGHQAATHKLFVDILERLEWTRLGWNIQMKLINMVR